METQMIRSSTRLLETCFIYVLLTLLGAVTVYGQPAKPSPAAPAALSREGAREPFFLSAESARTENGDSLGSVRSQHQNRPSGRSDRP